MRVLHVIPSVAARYGGPSVAVVEMVRALREVGVEAEIATTDADGPTRLRVPIGRPTTWQGVPTTFFRCRASEAWKWSPELASWLRRAASGFSFLHLHGLLSHAPLAAAASARTLDLPYAVRPLGTLEPWSLSQKAMRKRLVLRLAGRRALEEAAFVHYTTDQELQLTEKRFGTGKGRVIPLGVRLPEPGDSVEGPVPDEPYLVTLGRLHPKKGLLELISAFGAATDDPELHAWRLVIVGDGETTYRARLVERANRLAPGKVSFPGWLDGQRKRAVLESATAAVFPSQQENFGLALAECLACGVPVISSDRTGLANRIATARAGWIAPLGSAVLIETLVRVMKGAGSPEHGRYRQRAQALGDSFRWESVATQLATAYRETSETVPSLSALRARSA